MAVDADIDFLMVDLEIHGKQERQRNRDTLVSRHELADVALLRRVCPAGRLMVRINPWGQHSVLEVARVLDYGADIIMLPMYREPSEVTALLAAVAGRAGVVPLVETPQALSSVGLVAAMPGVSRMHFGLNDLHIALGRKFMFELLTDGTLDVPINSLCKAGALFGIGGVARVDEGLVPAQIIIGEHVRLGATAAILSRTFHRRGEAFSADGAAETLKREIAKIRDAHRLFAQASKEILDANRIALAAAIDNAKSQFG